MAAICKEVPKSLVHIFLAMSLKLTMLRNDIFAVGFVTTHFFISVVLLQFENSRALGLVMSLFSPFFLCWMVYTILRFGKYAGPDLGKDEYGYQDRPKVK
jgi:hypothetical protein